MSKVIVFFCFLFAVVSCRYNVSSTWILPIEEGLGINKIIKKEKRKKPKNEKDYLLSKKILLLNTSSNEAVEKEIFDNIDLLINFFFSQKNYQMTYQFDFTNSEKEKFKKHSKLFLEDFLFSFRVNKDLSKKAFQARAEQLLFIPQIIFWVCEQCKEENIIFFRISLIDIENGELVWIAENFYKFSDTPSQQQVAQKTQILWQQMIKKLAKDFR